MSPRRFELDPPDAVSIGVTRFWTGLGILVRDARLAKNWTVPDLARRAAVSRTIAYLVEAGHPTSLEAVIRVSNGLGLRLDAVLTDPKRKQRRADLSADPVHSAMGEFEAAHLRALGFGVGVDEPYQHYQFAGRADIVAWDVDTQALLHIENRTRFPDFQEMAGAFNAKRAYLADALAERSGVRRWASQTHVIAALWSSEVLHALRLRTNSFQSICPDPTGAFEAWWRGEPPASGAASVFVVLDPRATARQRPFVGLDAALSVRPRFRGYSDAASTLERNADTVDARRSG